MKSIKYLGIVLTVGVIAVIGAVSVKANPSYFSPTVQTNIATTTVNYLTPGTGTTTLTYDTFNNGNNYKSNSAVVLTQFAGSSTSAILGATFEFSHDGVDWYQDNLSQGATTSPSMNLTNKNTYSIQFANQTVGGAGGTNATTTKAIRIDTPVRYVRAVYTITGANGTVWGQIVPNKEKAE